jgi:hypothetical protein
MIAEWLRRMGVELAAVVATIHRRSCHHITCLTPHLHIIPIMDVTLFPLHIMHSFPTAHLPTTIHIHHHHCHHITAVAELMPTFTLHHRITITMRNLGIILIILHHHHITTLLPIIATTLIHSRRFHQIIVTIVDRLAAVYRLPTTIARLLLTRIANETIIPTIAWAIPMMQAAVNLVRGERTTRHTHQRRRYHQIDTAMIARLAVPVETNRHLVTCIRVAGIKPQAVSSVEDERKSVPVAATIILIARAIAKVIDVVVLLATIRAPIVAVEAAAATVAAVTMAATVVVANDGVIVIIGMDRHDTIAGDVGRMASMISKRNAAIA